MEDDEVWITKDGRRIKVGDLDLVHAQNILRMILRNWRERAVAIKVTRRLTETKEQRAERVRRVIAQFESWDEQ